MRAWLSCWIVALAGIAPTGTPAQTISPAPDSVAVTIYRAPDRSADTALDRAWLRGYALVTERRRVRVPAGRTVLRFEGVAAGMLAESAIVSGLPRGVREKNLDADLLSPRSLFARGFGRPVTIRRTIARRTVEQPAIIRSGPDGAAIVQTSDGFEAVDCGLRSDALVYGGVPAGLSAKPTLSVALDAPVAAETMVTLSYLAWGFDWQANYVVTLRPDGRSADLLAWVTLASGDTTSFPAAETIVVAGKAAREDSAPGRGDRAEGTLELHCLAVPPPAPSPVAFAPPGIVAMRAMDVEAPQDIVVTARRVVQEDLGDLKLYRVPDRTTVAAMAQKQVALLERKAVPVGIVHVSRIAGGGDAQAPQIALRMVNRKDRGLGVPLPAGPVALFQPRGGASLLIGEGAIADKAVGEEVEAKVAQATQVTIASDNPDSGDGWNRYVLTVRNANPHPIAFEAQFTAAEIPRLSRMSGTLARRDGLAVWAVTVPANGARTFHYRIADEE